MSGLKRGFVNGLKEWLCKMCVDLGANRKVYWFLVLVLVLVAVGCVTKINDKHVILI